MSKTDHTLALISAKFQLYTPIPIRKRSMMPTFPHRLNWNGSYDSICTECHQTIASSPDEAGLAREEQDHACNPTRLFQLAADSRNKDQIHFSY